VTRRPRRTLVWLEPEGDPQAFPAAECALDEPPGLLAAGGDLRPERLLAAYRRGIFPWYSPGQPILWWCPDPREVLLPAEFRRSRSLGKRERNAGFEVRENTAFAAVIEACAAPREIDGGGTWITVEMRDAYLELHRLGFAHSIETWRHDELVGGLYGVKLGRVFFGESMFSRESDASKVALSGLIRRAAAHGIELVDCQMPTRHLGSLGSRPMPRSEFLPLLARLIDSREGFGQNPRSF
jgi:leucyl/phenylalanyl-tRNA---protein transferase